MSAFDEPLKASLHVVSPYKLPSTRTSVSFFCLRYLLHTLPPETTSVTYCPLGFLTITQARTNPLYIQTYLSRNLPFGSPGVGGGGKHQKI